jgi:putative oxidoreductase
MFDRRTTRCEAVRRTDATDEEPSMSIVRRLARVMIAAPFVVLGYEAAAEPGGRVDLAAKLGVPQPELAVRANGALMVAGGAVMALGGRARLAAVALAGSLVPTTLAGHAYWEHDDPVARTTNRIQFLKNLGLAGGLLLVATSRERGGRRRGADASADRPAQRG